MSDELILIRADRDTREARSRWRDASERNLSLLAEWMAGHPPAEIAQRFDITEQRVYRLAVQHGVIRFKRIDERRPKRRNDPVFWANVEVTPGCWIWRGAIGTGGYGAFKGQPAHRFILAETLGRPLGADELACHHCDNPPCVRPDHLYAGTTNDNARDVIARGRQNLHRRDGVTPV